MSFPISNEAKKQHNEGHHAQNIMLNNTNKPQNVDPIDGMQVPKDQTVSLEKQERDIYNSELQKLQKENQNSRAKLACTQNNIVTETNHMCDESVNGEENNLVDKFKDQISITCSQINQDKQEMTNIASGL